jgi:hypothetical protein
LLDDILRDARIGWIHRDDPSFPGNFLGSSKIPTVVTTAREGPQEPVRGHAQNERRSAPR